MAVEFKVTLQDAPGTLANFRRCSTGGSDLLVLFGLSAVRTRRLPHKRILFSFSDPPGRNEGFGGMHDGRHERAMVLPRDARRRTVALRYHTDDDRHVPAVNVC